MRSLDQVTAVSLLLIGLGLCVANLWYAAERSTIPMALNGTVTQKRVGIEKHSGIDDVYLVKLDDQPPLRIDRKLFDSLIVGSKVYKVAWRRELSIDDNIAPLTWSRDFYGLIWCMGSAILIMLTMILRRP